MPPNLPFPVSGTILDTDSTALSGATVRAWNKRTGKKTIPDSITNSSGNYIVDLANFSDGDYVNGDLITLEVISSDGRKIVQSRFTLAVSDLTKELNLTIEFLDPLQVIESGFDDNWDRSTTDGIKPSIQPVFEQKVLDSANKDYVLLYSPDEGFELFGMGGSSFKETPMISIDIRTTFKVTFNTDVRIHLIKMKREVYRLIQLLEGSPGRKYCWLVPRRARDLTDKRTGIGRIVVDVELRKYGAV